MFPGCWHAATRFNLPSRGRADCGSRGEGAFHRARARRSRDSSRQRKLSVLVLVGPGGACRVKRASHARGVRWLPRLHAINTAYSPRRDTAALAHRHLSSSLFADATAPSTLPLSSLSVLLVLQPLSRICVCKHGGHPSERGFQLHLHSQMHDAPPSSNLSGV